MSPHRRSVAFGVLVVAAVFLASCSGGSDGVMSAGKGQIRIVMSSPSAPLSTSGSGTPTARSVSTSASRLGPGATPTCDRPDLSLKAASVTLSSILARTLDGQLVDVSAALPTTFDLLALGGGNEVTLPIGFLPPGTYDQIVVVITSLELTLSDDTKVTVTPPGGGWTAIVNVTAPFTVVEGQTTTVNLEFRRDLSFGCGGDGWAFDPKFDCDGSHEDDGDHD